MAADNPDTQDEASRKELERIEGMHVLTTAHLKALIFAPVDDSSHVLRVLDSATAGGRWIKELHAENPSRYDCTGTDLTDVYFPQGQSAIEFFEWDITKPWPGDRPANFDLVHQRFSLGAIPKTHLRSVVMNLAALVRPGGWIQLMESYLVGVSEKSRGLDWVWYLLREVYGKMGSEPDLHEFLPGFLEEAGFRDIQSSTVTIPVGISNSDPVLARLGTQTMLATADKLLQGGKYLGVDCLANAKSGSTYQTIEAEVKERGGSYTVYAIWGKRES